MFFCFIIWVKRPFKVSQNPFSSCLETSRLCTNTHGRFLHCCFLPEHCHSLSPQNSSRELSCQPKSLSLMLPHVQRLSPSWLHVSIQTAVHSEIPWNLCGLLRLCGHTVRHAVLNQTDNSDIRKKYPKILWIKD